MKSSVFTYKQRNLLVILLLWIYSSIGQNTNKSYLTEPAIFNTKFLQNTVTGLAKDEAGMLWAVTQYGCYRYDGFNTNIFVSNNTPTNPVRKNTGIMLDRFPNISKVNQW